MFVRRDLISPMLSRGTAPEGKKRMILLRVHFIVGAYVEEADFPVGDFQDQDHTIGVSQADGVFALMFTLEGMEAESGRPGVRFELFENILKKSLQVGMTL